MATVFKWLDYSDHERRKALEVIDLFQEQDTRDELGIGAIRDAFADLLFPGTSTIQTRAKYFLFIPWIYLDLERRAIPSATISGQARANEIKLIDALAESGDADGTIGIEARASLKRLASNIYWQGLADWGIRLCPDSQDQYHRHIDAFYLRRGSQLKTDDGELIDARLARNWHAGLPAQPSDFPKKASFQLSRREAEYFLDRILSRAPQTLLAFLVDRGRLVSGVDFPWQHPQFAGFSAQVRLQLNHGRLFSQIIHGASLLYNLMLSEAATLEDRIGEYRERLLEWARARGEQADKLAHWDRQQFWAIVAGIGRPVSTGTRRFVDSWIDLALPSQSIADDQRARPLIEARERALKGSQARLANPRALERWNGAAGTAQLNYRWTVSHRIISDIQRGLAREAADA